MPTNEGGKNGDAINEGGKNGVAINEGGKNGLATQFVGRAGIEVVEHDIFVAPIPLSSALYAEQALLIFVVTTLFSSTANVSCVGVPSKQYDK